MRKLSEIVVLSGKSVYRDIVTVAVMSIITSLFLVPVIFFLPIGFALALLPFVYFPLIGGAVYATNKIAQGRKAYLADLFAGARKMFWPSVVFGALFALFVFILVSSWWYYGQQNSIFYFALAIFQTYFVAMVFVSQVYTLSLVAQEELGIFTAIGRSVKLFLAHPSYTVGVFFQLACLTLVLLLTVVGFAALYLGMAGIYLNYATANLLPKEEETEEEEDWKLGQSYTILGKEW